MQVRKMKQLNDLQLEYFDTEFVNPTRWQIVKVLIDKDFPDGNFKFLDVGGGNGVFTDRLLQSYPNSEGTVLDNSKLLLSKNVSHLRKNIICDSVENLSNLNQKYDLINFNWVLHHLVGKSYDDSRNNMLSALHSVETLLTDNGRVSIFENMYDGIFLDNLPSHLIFKLTSMKIIASIIHKMGANTAGVGVCFLSKKQWVATLNKTHFFVQNYADDKESKSIIPITHRIFLHLGHVRVGHFWLSTGV